MKIKILKNQVKDLNYNKYFNSIEIILKLLIYANRHTSFIMPRPNFLFQQKTSHSKMSSSKSTNLQK